MGFKKLITGLLTAALCVGVVGAAHAQGGGQQRLPVRWVTQGTQFSSLSGDSSIVSEGAGFNADTTAAIPLWKLGKPRSIRTGAAVDTVSWFRFDFAPTGASDVTAGADSLWIGAQVSRNGVAWTTITPTRTFTAAFLSSVSGSVTINGVIALESGTSNQFSYTYPYVLLAVPEENAVGLATTAPSELQLADWPFIRFIVGGDFTGRFEAWVVGPQ